jgi:anti-sigma factor RsiW
MASKNTLGKASRAAQAAKSNPYLQRLIDDEQVRASLLSAYEAARGAYDRIGNGKPPTTALFEDKKLQEELKRAAESLRDASVSLRDAPAAQKAGRTRRRGRRLLLLVLGSVLAIAFSEGLRSKVLDMMFGAEEEFDYGTAASAATPAPEPAVAGGA